MTIGLFDSGVGGLSVLRRLRERQVKEDCLYFADTAHMPYGPRSPEELREIVFAICDFLVEAGCRLIVMACNTSSALVLPLAVQRYNVPVIGVLSPGAKAAATSSATGRIAVWATQATTASRAYEQQILSYLPDARVFNHACPELASLIEQGVLNGPIMEETLQGYLASLPPWSCDTLVLGCTHYPFVQDALAPLLPPGMTVVDPAEEAAALVSGMTQDSASKHGKTTYLVSGALTSFIRVAEGLWPEKGEVQQVRFVRSHGALQVEMADQKGISELVADYSSLTML